MKSLDERHIDHGWAQTLGALATALGSRIRFRTLRVCMDSMDPSEMFVGGPDPRPTRHQRVFPLVYAARVIGMAEFAFDEAPSVEQLSECESFVRCCALLSSRFRMRRWCRQRIGHPLMLVGFSPALQQLEVFVERAAQSDLPVLLRGPFGTEKTQLAAAIHAGSDREHREFIEIDCADAQGTPAQWLADAAGGTLYLNGVDTLPLALQSQLTRSMGSRLGQWLAPCDPDQPRIIASCSTELRELVDQGGFSRPLFVELDFLSARVPPLCDRPDDIVPLVMATLEQLGMNPSSKLSPEVIALCQQYSWPENQCELQRVIARLAVLSGPSPIHLDALASQLGLHAPHAAQPAAAAQKPLADSGATDQVKLKAALAQDLESLGDLHLALRRALQFLYARYCQPLTLEQVADHAHVSASHLSYLFRCSLGTSFKSLLIALRVHRAKQLLAEAQPCKITEVALSVGFNDLSHFEKCFRRAVGASPRHFRSGHVRGET